MEMTIDEIIKRIETVKDCDKIALKGYENGHESLEKDIEAFEGAMNIVRKYQEIRKIYMTHHYTDEEVIEKIKEVIRWE